MSNQTGGIVLAVAFLLLIGWVVTLLVWPW